MIVVHVVADQAADVLLPFPVRLVPPALLD